MQRGKWVFREKIKKNINRWKRMNPLLFFLRTGKKETVFNLLIRVQRSNQLSPFTDRKGCRVIKTFLVQLHGALSSAILTAVLGSKQEESGIAPPGRERLFQRFPALLPRFLLKGTCSAPRRGFRRLSQENIYCRAGRTAFGCIETDSALTGVPSGHSPM